MAPDRCPFITQLNPVVYGFLKWVGTGKWVIGDSTEKKTKYWQLLSLTNPPECYSIYWCHRQLDARVH